MQESKGINTALSPRNCPDPVKQIQNKENHGHVLKSKEQTQETEQSGTASHNLDKQNVPQLPKLWKNGKQGLVGRESEPKSSLLRLCVCSCMRMRVFVCACARAQLSGS